jgi:6-phosphogluconate dehydrogenase
LLVKAGDAIDAFIQQLLPFLEQGDIVIDGGNSHFPDTIRRCKELEARGLLFVGCGVSGGEEGARYGPSLMPGGSNAAWYVFYYLIICFQLLKTYKRPHLKEIFQSIAAKADGEPCCDWVGETGAGHYVKMVHNGIEYGDMQLICEAYQLMRDALQMSPDEMAAAFNDWNSGELDSFLIEITRDILAYRDPVDGKPTVEKIRDTAGQVRNYSFLSIDFNNRQKGTGKWTAISSLDMGTPVTLIGEAVFARCLSALKDERVRASQLLSGPGVKFTGDKKQFIEDIRQVY